MNLELESAGIPAWYAPLVEAGSPLTIAQLGQSLDGFIASRTGDACYVTGPQDRCHLHQLRSLVDAVVVGGATVTMDNSRLTVRAVQGRHPVRVVLDPRGRIPADSHVLTDPIAPTLWIVGSRAPEPGPLAAHVDVVRLPVRDVLPPQLVLEALHSRGLQRVLVEGGGRLVSAFVSARLIDRLYVTTAPLLIGDGVPGLRFTGADALADALRGPSRRLMLGDDVCTEIVLTP
ncbi:RibD family protein [Gephyromycinifex aptenodytis]|uniref:RibD family protein n=1 Tax=Gephyromycinifex aptenodytis TaxID=2716227 RepID=UPI001447F054|nr:RibD family protein [Gephyromycinifex aptenodytis]